MIAALAGAWLLGAGLAALAIGQAIRIADERREAREARARLANR